MPKRTKLSCPRCPAGRFFYSRGKSDSDGNLTVRVRECPSCGLIREDTHSVLYREAGPAPEPSHPGEGGVGVTGGRLYPDPGV